MRSSATPVWIAFDAVGTLIHPDPPVAVAYAETARRHGSTLTVDEIRPRFHRVWEASETQDLAGTGSPATIDPLATNEGRERRRWQWIVSQVIHDVADSDACCEELWAHFARPGSWRCFPDVAESLADLAAAGFQLAVASNFDRRLPPICANQRALKPIQLCVVSSVVGYRKPSPHFFAALSQATGCPTDRLLMVGDDFNNDVAGARVAGLPARFLNRRDDARPAPDQIANLFELRDELVGAPPAGGQAG